MGGLGTNILRSCWADEVDVDYGIAETWSSGDALNDFVESFHTGLITMHMNANFDLEDAGPNRVMGRTYFKAILKRGDGSLLMRADGWYDDKFEKVLGEWKITRRNDRLIDMKQGVK